MRTTRFPTPDLEAPITLNKYPLSSRVWCLGFFVLSLASHTVSGAVVLSPATVVGSDLGSFAAETALDHMIDQSGVQTPFVSGSTDFDTYFADPPKTWATNGGTNNWQSDFSFNLPLTGYVDFDLGASYKINKIAIWNVSVKDVTVKVFDDLNGPEQIAGTFKLTNHWNFPFSYPVDILDFGAEYKGRYVRLAITSAYLFSIGDTFAYAIIGEVVVSAGVDSVTPPTPALDIILNPNGDVTVTFTGTLQTATAVDGTFADVTGNPQGTHTLPKGSLLAQQYFRARSN
jgi:hypothetical protein